MDLNAFLTNSTNQAYAKILHSIKVKNTDSSLQNSLWNQAFLKKDLNIVKSGSLTVEDNSCLFSSVLSSVDLGTIRPPICSAELAVAVESVLKINFENVSRIALTNTLLCTRQPAI